MDLSKRCTGRLLTAGSLVAIAGCVTASANGAVAADAHGPAPVAAHIWVTTPDGTDKLSDLGTVAFSSAATTVPTVVVDPTQTFQTMQGFGGALTDSSASVLYGLSP